MAKSNNETTRLVANQESVDAYNKPIGQIEWYRAFGLSMGLVMLGVGTQLTNRFVFPITNGPKTIEDTYINKVFGFTHTCVYIDFNPSKTVAAILVNFVTLPLMMFTFLHQARLDNECCGNPRLTNINCFSRCTWQFRFCCFALFSLCFVNSPDGEYLDPFDTPLTKLIRSQGWQKYMVHYIPFFLWQISLVIMSIEQTWYHYLNDSIFGIPKRSLLYYNWALIIVQVYYTIWILGFMFGFHVPGHTVRDENTGEVKNKLWGLFIMYLTILLSTVVPLLMSWCRVYGWFGTTPSKDYTITISPFKKKYEKDEEN